MLNTFTSAWNGKQTPGTPIDVAQPNGGAEVPPGGESVTTSGSKSVDLPRSQVDKAEPPQASRAKSSSSKRRDRAASQMSSGSSVDVARVGESILQLIDPNKPEDSAAIHRFGERIRSAGTDGAKAVVDVLSRLIQDQETSPQACARAISAAQILAQRSVAGTEPQRFLASESFVNALREATSNPTIRAALKGWASQIRSGDPNNASVLAPITELDAQLSKPAELRKPARRPPPHSAEPSTYLPNQNTSAQLRSGAFPQAGGGHDDSATTPRSLGVPMPGGFGSVETPSAAGRPGWLQPVPEHLTSSPQPIDSLEAPQSNVQNRLDDEDDGLRSDAPSIRRERPSLPTTPLDRDHNTRVKKTKQRDGNGRLGYNTFAPEGAPSEHEAVGLDENLSARAPPRDFNHYNQYSPVSPITSGFRSRSPSPSREKPRRHIATTRGLQPQSHQPADPATVLLNLTGVRFVRAIEEYQAARQGELTLRQGETLAVIRSEDNGRFLLGHRQGQVGLFPAHVVEPVSVAHQSGSGAQEGKIAELLRRAREIDDFMDQLHEFDITRFCVTEDPDIQVALTALLGLRNTLVRQLDATTTSMGHLKAMLNRIKEAQRVHDKMIDSRIASYTARSALNDATPRNLYQELPSGLPSYTAFDMAQYMRRIPTSQQIEQPPSPHTWQQTSSRYDNHSAHRYRPSPETRYGAPTDFSGRTRTYSHPPSALVEENSSTYTSSEPTTPADAVNTGGYPTEMDPNSGRQSSRRGKPIRSKSSVRGSG